MADVARLAQHQLEDLLAFFGMNIKVDAELRDQTLELMIDTEDSGRLIGHHGETLAALQHLMNMFVQHHTTERIYVHVDVGGYRKARAERLVAQAIEQAKKVIETDQEALLPPMSSGERRLVHMKILEIPGVTTESRGEGRDRRLAIIKAD